MFLSSRLSTQWNLNAEFLDFFLHVSPLTLPLFLFVLHVYTILSRSKWSVSGWMCFLAGLHCSRKDLSYTVRSLIGCRGAQWFLADCPHVGPGLGLMSPDVNNLSCRWVQIIQDPAFTVFTMHRFWGFTLWALVLYAGTCHCNFEWDEQNTKDDFHRVHCASRQLFTLTRSSWANINREFSIVRAAGHVAPSLHLCTCNVHPQHYTCTDGAMASHVCRHVQSKTP